MSPRRHHPPALDDQGRLLDRTGNPQGRRGGLRGGPARISQMSQEELLDFVSAGGRAAQQKLTFAERSRRSKLAWERRRARATTGGSPPATTAPNSATSPPTTGVVVVGDDWEA